MRRVLMGGILLCSLGIPACVAQPDVGGPLPVRNQHPAQLTVMHMDPRDASVLSKGAVSLRTDFAYTSLFLYGSQAADSWIMDGEFLRTDLDTQIGLGSGLQLGIQLAAAHTSGGFLDSFLVDYHDLLGLPDQDRSINPSDQFTIEARQNGQQVWSVDESAAEFLDVPIYLTWQLREPGLERIGVAIRGGLELPTGDQNRGYGNGEVDYSFGGLLDYQASGIAYSGHLQHTIAGTPGPSRDAGFAFQDVTSAGIGMELPIQEDLHALIQAEWETSTLRDLGPSVTSREQLLLWVGGRYQATPDWAFEVGFGEDLISLASPDFTAWFAVAWKPVAKIR